MKRQRQLLSLCSSSSLPLLRLFLLPAALSLLISSPLLHDVTSTHQRASIVIMAAAQANTPDIGFLIRIKDKVRQSSPGVLSDWSIETNPCKGQWTSARITCDEETYRVIRLDLLNAGLKGFLPGQELAQLSSLKHLELGENQFSGPLPWDLLKLDGLTYLSVAQNKLDGDIHPDIGRNLTNLAVLNLSNNSFTGSIPTSLSFISQLSHLKLANNKFEGNIPSELSVLENLQHLSLRNNLLSGDFPSWISSLSSLRTLELQRNGLSGSLPPQLGDLPNLERLEIGLNQFSGQIPSSIGSLSKLQILDFNRNQFSGSIPYSISFLSSLLEIDLSRNEGLKGDVSIFFGYGTNMRFLHLEYCQFTGTLPSNLGKFQGLFDVDFSFNRLTQGIPESISRLSRLSSLALANNTMFGTLPTTFCQLSSLVSLDLHRNMFSGHIPTCITTMPALSSVDLRFNRFTGRKPVDAQLNLRVDGNCLSGLLNQDAICVQDTEDQTSRDDGSGNDDGSYMPPGPTSNSSSSGGGYRDEEATGDEPPDSSNGAEPPQAEQQQQSSGGSEFTLGWVVKYALIGILAGIVTLACVGGFVTLLQHNKQRPVRQPPPTATYIAVNEFSIMKVKKATKNFSTEFGRGSFGTVYLAEDFLGQVEPDRHAVVKRAHDPDKLNEAIFKSKVELLSRARHRNLVNLLGYCVGKGERILIYEYCPNGSLYDHLHRPELETLPWEARVRIAVNLACALEFLHHSSSSPMIHRAVTSQNILLTASMVAKLADYGLARGSGGAGSVFGTSEAPKRRKPRSQRDKSIDATNGVGLQDEGEKADVYGFGVVLLELITGQKAMKEVHVTALAAPFMEDTQMMPLMADSALGGYFEEAELIQLAIIARDCVQEDPAARPSMREAVRRMEENLGVDTQLTDSLDELESGRFGYGALSKVRSGRDSVASFFKSTAEKISSSVKSAFVSPRVTLEQDANSTTSGKSEQEMSTLLTGPPKSDSPV